jgi:hypothetical protein
MGKDPFSLVIEGSGVVNGTQFTAQGRGEGDTASGALSFGVDFSAIADNTDPVANLLGVLILITGLFGKEIDGAENLLTLSDGDFYFTQVLAGDGVDINSSGKLSRTGEREFTWSSYAEGEAALSSVSEIHPFKVIMIPAGHGKLIETGQWPIVDEGELKQVQAIRHFSFDPAAQLRDHQLRDVAIKPRIDGLSVRLDIDTAVRRLPARKPRR